MRIPYGFILTGSGALEINKDEASVIAMIFDSYIAGASLGKIVNGPVKIYAQNYLQAPAE